MRHARAVVMSPERNNLQIFGERIYDNMLRYGTFMAKSVGFMPTQNGIALQQ